MASAGGAGELRCQLWLTAFTANFFAARIHVRVADHNRPGDVARAAQSRWVAKVMGLCQGSRLGIPRFGGGRTGLLGRARLGSRLDESNATGDGQDGRRQ